MSVTPLINIPRGGGCTVINYVKVVEEDEVVNEVVVKDEEVVVKDEEVVVKDEEVVVKDGEVVVKDGEVVVKDGEVVVKDGEVVVKDGEAKTPELSLSPLYLQSVITTLATTHQHLIQTTDRSSLQQLLSTVKKAIIEPDPIIAERLQRDTFTEVCGRLRIAKYLVDVVFKESKASYKRKWWSCFSC
ncbi:MAG: hypothetical protein WC208_15475 [Gallionella sp.]